MRKLLSGKFAVLSAAPYHATRLIAEAAKSGGAHYLDLTEDFASTRAVSAALREISEVRLLHSVSGDVDLIAVAVTSSVAQMDQVIDQIGALDGVERTNSSIILSTKFER